jgi:hypothetical protein
MNTGQRAPALRPYAPQDAAPEPVLPPREPGNAPEGEPGNAPEGEPLTTGEAPDEGRPPARPEGTVSDPDQYGQEGLAVHGVPPGSPCGTVSDPDC